jgi:hypothetical protein
MKDWLHSISENYPLIWLAIVWIGIGVAALILNIEINRLLDRLGNEKRIQFSFAKSIFWGIAIPTVGMWMWFSSYDNPFNEYRLITNPTTVNGFINKVEQESDVVEYNDSRSAAVVYFYYYEFTFKLPNGRTIQGGGKENGDIPEYLADVAKTPYQIIVEYLSDNPKVNRVKGMESGNKTLYAWLRYPILMGIIVLLLCSYFSFMIINGGLKEYRTELQNLKRHDFE